jgi:CIC family chloride channel protein
MGAVFAGAARAPITAVVILFELTGEYSIILPMMLAIVLGTGISHLVSRDTVYTLKLMRRGIDIDEPADATLRRQPVTDFMVEPPAAVNASEHIRTVASRFALTGENSLPVVDDQGRYVGTLRAHDLMDALAAGEFTDITRLAQQTEPVAVDGQVGAVLHRLDRGEDAVPIADAEGRLVGWVRQRDMLAALSLRPS